MIPPDNIQIFEGALAKFWFDENGILCAVSKPTLRTIETQRENYEFIKNFTGNQRVCLLADTTTTSPQDKATREYMAKELPNVFKAMAIISRSPLGYFITNLFLAIKHQPIPIKFFKSEKDAKEWLMQFL